jgi:SAM-dependent methyltransferase
VHPSDAPLFANLSEARDWLDSNAFRRPQPWATILVEEALARQASGIEPPLAFRQSNDLIEPRSDRIMPNTKGEVRGTATAVDQFEKRWATYQKVMSNNYIFHQEVYQVLREKLVETQQKAFRFLDIACGDAAASVAVLKTTAVAEYHGIDLSGPALALARENLKVLDCPVHLYEKDFSQALANWNREVDAVWIGQSLHHLAAPEKLQLMKHVRGVLGRGGVFLIWEPTLREGEVRNEWMTRFDAHSRANWSLLPADELETVAAHNRQFDHPEAMSSWLALGSEAGFSETEQVYLDPPRMAGVYMYQNLHLT